MIYFRAMVLFSCLLWFTWGMLKTCESPGPTTDKMNLNIWSWARCQNFFNSSPDNPNVKSKLKTVVYIRYLRINLTKEVKDLYSTEHL